MKVLHLLKSNIYSGAETVVVTMIKSLDDVESIYLSPSGPIDERLLQEGITHYVVDKLSVKSIREAVKKEQPDIVHAHDFTASVLAAIACKNKIPVVSHLHCNPSWLATKNAKTIMYKMVSKYFDKVFLVSDSIEEEYVFANTIKSKSVVLGNPFSKDAIIAKAKEEIPTSIEAKLDAFCNEDINKIDVNYVGRLSEEKNPIGFVEIVGELAKENPDIKAVMIGAGAEEEKCINLINERGLSNNILMLGFCANPYPILAKAKTVVMPSHWEGFGLVALEAMALGKVVACSGAGGLSKLVDDKCGAICKDIAEYKKCILDWLYDSALYEEKSKNAICQATSFDNVEKYSSTVLAHYNELLK